MYEMEGPRRALRRSSVPITRLPRAAGLPPVLATRAKRRLPGLPASPGVAPGWRPPVVVKQFYCLAAGPHKGFPEPAP
jgi:hypothetical protein